VENKELDISSAKVDRAETLPSIFSKSDGKVITLSVHNKLDGISADDPPMHEFAPWSRFVVYGIRDGAQVLANIPATEVAYILDQSRKADWLEAMSETDEVTSCYKVTLSGKKYKDRTPAEILLENPAEKEGLTEQYKFLRSNVQKFPRNKIQMDAIAEAINLQNEGKLVVHKSPVTDIYTEDIKYLKSKTDKEGRVLVYSISIRYTAGQTSPITVAITNCYANLSASSGGQALPDMKNAVGQTSFEIHCPYKEWFCLIDAMADQVRNFKAMNYAVNIRLTREYVSRRNSALGNRN